MIHTAKGFRIVNKAEVDVFSGIPKEMATHSSILVWRIPRTKEPGGLQSMGSQRVYNTTVPLSLGQCRAQGPSFINQKRLTEQSLYTQYFRGAGHATANTRLAPLPWCSGHSSGQNGPTSL